MDGEADDVEDVEGVPTTVDDQDRDLDGEADAGRFSARVSLIS